MRDIRRRELVTLLGGTAAAAWPIATRAQDASKLPTIGFLGASTPSTASYWVTAFMQRLRELGWTEGRNGTIESKPGVSYPMDRTSPTCSGASPTM